MQALSRRTLAAPTDPLNAGYYYLQVSTIQDIRRANLNFLLQEVEHDIGTPRGAAAELSRRTGVAQPFISQFLRHKEHSGGAERAMGDKQARKLERGMDKPPGWMDVDRLVAADWNEAAMLDQLRRLTEDQRSAVKTLLTQLLHSSGER